MANNVPITAGSGTSIAADDVSSVWYQRVKLVNGTEDATDAIPGDATNGLDVDVTRVPATTTKHKAYTQSIATALTTELNSLANVTASAESSAIDNTTNLDLYMDLELFTDTQSARTAGALVRVYMQVSLDGTNYGSARIGTSELIATIPYDAAVTATRRIVRNIEIPQALFKLLIYNASTQAFAATANTLKYRTHSLSNV